EQGMKLLFSDEVSAAELELTAPFGDGRYHIKGRVDRLQHHAGKLLIADLKYKEKKKLSEKYRLADLVEEPNSFDERFQLLIYAYLALHSAMATPDSLDAAYIFLRPNVRGDYLGRLAETELAERELIMERITQRLDRMLKAEGFVPNCRAEGCPYCPYKALCLKPDLYRTGGRPW
ncbi:MAG: PD-(D/E)XK nuclease family protein, partial [Coriobacteriia bacterium]|nr:PD-(D/E)XK nuclease family protein [Coriobacteriia bacterium]